MSLLQANVGQWVLDTFGRKIFYDRRERAMRLLEEAIELAQAERVSVAQASALVERVYSRPSGQSLQELGGVGVTFLAMAEAMSTDADLATRAELRRIERPEIIAMCRKKQAQKAELGLGIALPDDAA